MRRKWRRLSRSRSSRVKSGRRGIVRMIAGRAMDRVMVRGEMMGRVTGRVETMLRAGMIGRRWVIGRCGMIVLHEPPAAMIFRRRWRRIDVGVYPDFKSSIEK